VQYSRLRGRVRQFYVTLKPSKVLTYPTILSVFYRCVETCFLPVAKGLQKLSDGFE
jgi:hypothetical protein